MIEIGWWALALLTFGAMFCGFGFALFLGKF